MCCSSEAEMTYTIGQWAWCIAYDEPCRLIEMENLWGASIVRVWLPTRDIVVRVPESGLRALDGQQDDIAERLTFVAAAARIADTLASDALIAPLEGSVIPLPHQIHALSRAVSGDSVRYLLADEVGLGKTIEAGMIFRELKLRGLVTRVLIVAPAGLVTQWVAEMRAHFNEEFHVVLPRDFSALRQITQVDEQENLWRMRDQVVCPMDSVKPMDSRRGWSYSQVLRHNRERFLDLISAGWDLVIIDEAHRLGGSSSQVARYKLGEGLAHASPYLLLLSATPHQGKTDAFRRLMALLDEQAFIGEESIRREQVSPYVIRTEKQSAITCDGQPLFKPRFTQLVKVRWEDKHSDQQALYDAVTEYVREGYNQAIREKNTAIGFLMILMQRLITSSTKAIRRALERRLDALAQPSGQMQLFPEDIGEEWSALDGQEQMESLLKTRLKALQNERSEVELLLSAARRCEAKGPDVKAQGLLDWIQRLVREENDPELKILIFTEFIPTQDMLADFLQQRGFDVVKLNGSMSMEERQTAQRAFAKGVQVMVSTEAGGEGLNLQFCHIVFNYDLPWNPMRLEQRIGRVDRIGQTKVVRAFNFALDGTVELRVREVLEEKLQRILEEFGVDKLADVLDSEEGGVSFDDLYISAVLSPEDATARVEALTDQIRQRAQVSQQGTKILSSSGQLQTEAAQKIANHQLPFWTERMTLSFLGLNQRNGAVADKTDAGYRLRWPDGTEIDPAAFHRAEAEATGSTHVTLDDPNVRDLVSRLPHFAPGLPIPAIVLPGISEKVGGLWSLWRVTLHTTESQTQRILPIFVSDEGRTLNPTARAVWDRLLECGHSQLDVVASSEDGAGFPAYEASRCAAELQGREIFRELSAKHVQRIDRERRKGTRAFEARRRAMDRIGLSQVKKHRVSHLDKERQAWAKRMQQLETALPDLTAVLLMRVLRQGGQL
jgi:superfamily II DNA or RNA helicase